MSTAPSATYDITIASIREAQARIADGIVRTPCHRSAGLSALLGAEIYLKLETLQRSGSFKDRGALNRLLQLSEDERKRGVIAVSAGNHAQALAYHASRLGIEVTLVMPLSAPYAKVSRTQAFGGKVEQCGETLDDCMDRMRELQKQCGFIFVSPYDDAMVVAGQGTVGLEIAEDVTDIDCVVVPIGGGGLIAGIATALLGEEGEQNSKVSIIGVEAALYPTMHHLVKGADLQNPTSDGARAGIGGHTLAEGIAVKQPGVSNAKIVKRLVEDILLLDEPALERGVACMLEQGKVLAEGAGAAPLAAVLAHPQRFRGKKIVLMVCGANIDTRLLSSVLTRDMARNGLMAHIGVSISDQPGVLAKVSTIFGEAGANIIEVLHKRLFESCAAKEAELDIIAETKGPEHIQEVLARLRGNGFRAKRLHRFD